MRNQDRKPLEAAKKFTDKKSLRMSAVKLQASTSQEYLHTPLMFIVSMSTAHFDPRMSDAQGIAIQAQPSMTLSDINELTQNQRFDVTALVEEAEDPRLVKNDRVRRTAKLIDQAESASNALETKWTFL